MSSAPKVSILVPIFNVEKYLEECLDSIVNQTLSDIEIICINDGSTDSSPEIIKRYAKNDSRFVVINKKNSGYGDSMNRGLAKATGEYIGIVESDDFIDSDMFEKLYSLATRHTAEVAKSEFYYYYTDLTEKSPQWDPRVGGIYNRDQQKVIRSHDAKSNILHKDELNQVIDTTRNHHILYQKPAIWSAIYSRKFLLENDINFLPSPGASYQDTGFSFKVWAMAKRVIFTDEAFLHYRQDNEASSINSPGKVFCVSDEYNEIENFLRKKNKLEYFEPIMLKTKYGAYSWNFNRLAKGLDAEFLEVFTREYKEADESGALDYLYFSINERRDLKEIIHNPKMFLKRKHALNSARVSVVVPVYNVEKYLRKSLDSLVNQSLKHIEIICVNDGSPDNSISILEEYHAKDPRIVIRETSNRGLAAARNHGIASVSSDFIMFCDSDDYLSTDACEKMYNAITKHDVDIVMSGTNVIYSSNEFAHAYRRSDEEYYRLRFSGKKKITPEIIKKTDVSAWNKIYRTSIQRKYEVWFPKGLWYEDSTFFNNYMLVSQSAYFLKDKKLYNYVRREGSIMSTTAKKTKRAIDHVRAGMVTFEFMKRNDLVRDNAALFVDNFTKDFQFSRKYTPRENQNELNDIVRAFLKKNQNYLDSIDPSIRHDISLLLPALPLGVQMKRIIKNTIKTPMVFVFTRLSPTYRRQSSIMAMINGVDKKIDATDKLNAERVTKLSEQIALLQQSIDELKAKK